MRSYVTRFEIWSRNRHSAGDIVSYFVPVEDPAALSRSASHRRCHAKFAPHENQNTPRNVVERHPITDFVTCKPCIRSADPVWFSSSVKYCTVMDRTYNENAESGRYSPCSPWRSRVEGITRRVNERLRRLVCTTFAVKGGDLSVLERTSFRRSEEDRTATMLWRIEYSVQGMVGKPLGSRSCGWDTGRRLSILRAAIAGLPVALRTMGTVSLEGGS